MILLSFEIGMDVSKISGSRAGVGLGLDKFPTYNAMLQKKYADGIQADADIGAAILAAQAEDEKYKLEQAAKAKSLASSEAQDPYEKASAEALVNNQTYYPQRLSPLVGGTYQGSIIGSVPVIGAGAAILVPQAAYAAKRKILQRKLADSAYKTAGVPAIEAKGTPPALEKISASSGQRLQTQFQGMFTNLLGKWQNVATKTAEEMGQSKRFGVVGRNVLYTPGSPLNQKMMKSVSNLNASVTAVSGIFAEQEKLKTNIAASNGKYQLTKEQVGLFEDLDKIITKGENASKTDPDTASESLVTELNENNRKIANQKLAESPKYIISTILPELKDATTKISDFDEINSPALKSQLTKQQNVWIETFASRFLAQGSDATDLKLKSDAEIKNQLASMLEGNLEDLSYWRYKPDNQEEQIKSSYTIKDAQGIDVTKEYNVSPKLVDQVFQFVKPLAQSTLTKKKELNMQSQQNVSVTVNPQKTTFPEGSTLFATTIGTTVKSDKVSTVEAQGGTIKNIPTPYGVIIGSGDQAKLFTWKDLAESPQNYGSTLRQNMETIGVQMGEGFERALEINSLRAVTANNRKHIPMGRNYTFSFDNVWVDNSPDQSQGNQNFTEDYKKVFDFAYNTYATNPNMYTYFKDKAIRPVFDKDKRKVLYFEDENKAKWVLQPVKLLPSAQASSGGMTQSTTGDIPVDARSYEWAPYQQSSKRHTTGSQYWRNESGQSLGTVSAKPMWEIINLPFKLAQNPQAPYDSYATPSGKFEKGNAVEVAEP